MITAALARRTAARKQWRGIWHQISRRGGKKALASRLQNGCAECPFPRASVPRLKSAIIEKRWAEHRRARGDHLLVLFTSFSLQNSMSILNRHLEPRGVA
jgi:hypothetical protein